MIVEFVGAPGAGKTTLLPIVAESLTAQGRRPATVVEAARVYAARTLAGRAVRALAPPTLRDPLLWQVFTGLSALHRLAFCMRHPALIRHVLASQRGRPPAAAARERRVLYWFFRTAGYYQFLKRHRRAGEALLIDEGFVHRVVQLFSSSVEAPQPEAIAAYVRLLPRPDLIVVVDAGPDVCEGRVRRRGLWEHLQGRSTGDVSRFVRHAHRAVTLAVGEVEALGWPVVRVGNDGQISRARLELDEKLAAATGHREWLAAPVQAAGGDLW